MSVIKNLKLQFRQNNVAGFSLDIPSLELSDDGCTALWGASGSGKSTVVRCLLGLEECPGLSWILNGVDVARLPVQKRGLGVVFQNSRLFPHMTVKENIEFAISARGYRIDQSWERIQRLISRLAVGHLIDRSARNLSGGEQQRLSLIRSLAGRPQFIFLDEPFSALDEDHRGEARKLVGEVLAEEGIPALLITHDRHDVVALARKTIQIESGRIK